MPHYYRQVDDTTFEPTELVQGAWLPTEQHMSPVAGLLTHCLEHFAPRDDLQLCRLSFDILGVMRRETTQITCHMIRPGRTIELVGAEMTIGGRTAVRATGWRLARHDTSAVAGGLPERLPERDGLPAWAATDQWTGEYIASVDFRVAADGEPGRRRAWLDTDVDLLAEGPVEPLAEFVKLVDTANGVAARVDPREWAFPNTDLQIHLWRTPTRGPVGLDTRSTIGPDGVGLTHTLLHDRHGPVGRAEQILTVRPRP